MKDGRSRIRLTISLVEKVLESAVFLERIYRHEDKRKAMFTILSQFLKKTRENNSSLVVKVAREDLKENEGDVLGKSVHGFCSKGNLNLSLYLMLD